MVELKIPGGHVTEKVGSSRMRESRRTRFGIVGGLGPLAGADIFFKLVKSTPARSDREHFNVIFEQHPFDDGHAVADGGFDPNARKLYVFDTIKRLEARRIDAVILTCFISHTFIDELRSALETPIVNMMDALRDHVERRYPTVRRIGVLTSTYVRRKCLFERYFTTDRHELLYPSAEAQQEGVMEAIYGERGIKAGQLRGAPIELMDQACQDLVDQGAELILPGLTEIPIVIDDLRGQSSAPIIDSNQVYASYAIDHEERGAAKPFKVGIVGGVGPAATVDFMDKIISRTEAARDQDHIKMVVEHNPQIPDRTAHLVGDGQDPTIALYSTCKRLEEADADLIAIPCNTAHAFVERIQRYLAIPVVNMLYETVEFIKRHYADRQCIGLLATSGTVTSGVYADIIAPTRFQLVVPDPEFQKRVMNAIYGERGVKAGYTEGECMEELLLALGNVVAKGAEVVILGCTELPLLLAQTDSFPVGDKRVALLDPTDILARKCVALARAAASSDTRHGTGGL